MTHRSKQSKIYPLLEIGRVLIFSVTVITEFIADAIAQQAATRRTPTLNSENTATAPPSGANVPNGFMDITFGTALEDAEKLLAARNYKFQTRKDWQQIILKNAPLAGLSANDVTLTFSSEAGFYKGEARIAIDCDKNKMEGVEAFDKISRAIHSKYRRFPRVDEKLNRQRRNYWTTEWEFKTSDNKETAYEIKLYMQDDWKSNGGDWRKTSNILITYIATWAAPSGPVALKPPFEGL